MYNNNNASSSGGGSSSQRKFTIKPFRSYTQMDTTSAQQTFASLASAMDEIHNRNASTLSFEELYRNAYNLYYTNTAVYYMRGCKIGLRCIYVILAAS